MQNNGTEVAASQVLKRAIQLDSERKFSEAVTCYEQGIRLLFQAMKETNDGAEKKTHFKKKIEEYLSRAEIMKKAYIKQRDAQKNHNQIHIANGARGYSYEKIFSSLIDEILTTIEIEDAYIRSTHQIYNFLHFCELFLKKAPNLKKISLHTTPCTENHSLQKERLKEIEMSLEKHNVRLEVSYSNSLHDREIRLDNGWMIKIGRGLDYFKRPEGRFSVGYSDYDLRPCHETTIDIFPQSTLS